jgi:hypothetical protein
VAEESFDTFFKGGFGFSFAYTRGIVLIVGLFDVGWDVDEVDTCLSYRIRWWMVVMNNVCCM